jgi:hypothetical protein
MRKRTSATGARDTRADTGNACTALTMPDSTTRASGGDASTTDAHNNEPRSPTQAGGALSSLSAVDGFAGEVEGAPALPAASKASDGDGE